MKQIMGLGLFIHDKFMEEDGDGMNLLIITDERKNIEDKMKELVTYLVPARIGKDTTFYYVSDLTKTWKKAVKLLNYKAPKRY